MRLAGTAKPGRRMIITLVLCLMAAGWVAGQDPGGEPHTGAEQNETLLDTLRRMQIRREETEFKKLVEKAASIREGAEQLAGEMAAGGYLSRDHDKRLREMEKFARQIRSASGSSTDEKLKVVPGDAGEAVRQLAESSRRLQASLEKTSRRVVSVAVVDASCEVIELIRLIRLSLGQPPGAAISRPGTTPGSEQ